MLGFGYVAHFRTMRFLALSYLVLALLMGFTGFLNLKSSPQNDAGLSVADRISIANIETSHSTCIQQYVQLNQTRRINCTSGYIANLYSYGIVPSTTNINNYT